MAFIWKLIPDKLPEWWRQSNSGHPLIADKTNPHRLDKKETFPTILETSAQNKRHFDGHNRHAVALRRIFDSKAAIYYKLKQASRHISIRPLLIWFSFTNQSILAPFVSRIVDLVVGFSVEVVMRFCLRCGAIKYRARTVHYRIGVHRRTRWFCLLKFKRWWIFIWISYC